MLEEINIGPYPGRSSQTQEGHALSTAKKMIKGQTFYCNRIKAEVGARNCKSKYAYAKAQQISASPCLECAKVLAMIRKDPTPVEPQLEIDPKEIAAMARPAKKGTPDPIIEEVKAAVEPKLEIVATQKCETKQVVSQNKADLVDKNPFADWAKFSPRDQIRPGDVYARIGKTSMTLSAHAADTFGLSKYDSVDVYHADGKLGLHFMKGKAGAFTLTRATRGGRVRKLSCSSLVKGLKLDKLGAIDRRLTVREIAAGMIEVDLTSEVAA